MKNRNIGFGLTLLVIGTLLLLINLGVINWSIIDTLFEFWPVIFIVIGINIIFRDNEIVKIISWLAFIAIIVALSFHYNGNFNYRNNKWLKGNEVKIEKPTSLGQCDLKIYVGEH